ncbi:hypothetical protein APSETT444_000157 [Aspergillus pseudonomiae]
MVLTANPDRARPQAEKEEIAQRYKPGQSVFPTAASPENSTAESDDDDRRLIEEVRELSLRESGPRTREHRSGRSSRTRRGESADGDRRRADGRSRQQREEERATRHHSRTALSDPTERTRQIEHQSSLRSLLSLSDTETMQEEILRQILEEGLLDDIDMDNLGPAQEEELSERIADAYRRRHRLRSRSQQRNDWPGFGVSAKADLDRIHASSNGLATPSQESQHILLSLKYNRPSDAARRATRDGREVTNEHPARRLQTGLFCDICQSSADTCFWKCNQCNEGDWGFCNKCVNEGKCCTHALLPICRVTPDSPLTPATPAVPGDIANGSAAPLAGAETLKVLSFSTNCDICANQIPPSTLRFHCLQCNEGDYDICANCYLKLVATAKIRKDNGHNGWRRCLKGHRMVVVGFEDHEEGQKRVIVRDLVGGRALKDEHLQPSSPPASPSLTRGSVASSGVVPSPELGTGDWSWKEGAERRKKASRIRPPWSSTIGDRTNSYSEPSTPTTPTQNASSSRRFPPDGGVGLVVHALWPWYPEDGVKDELMFPRGAEITEAENINDDWYWGCYAGSTGLFPGTHVFIVGEIA